MNPHHWRKVKAYDNQMRKKLGYGKYFIDCRYHPCRVTKFVRDTYGDSVEGVSLFDGSGCSCSTHHCGPEPITKVEAERFAQYRKDHGFYAYLKHCRRFSDEGIEHFKKLDEEWKFNKG